MPKGPFRRSATDSVLAGVCGGLARHFGIDPTLTRVLWVVLTLVSAGAGILGYGLIWVLVEKE